MAVKEFLLQHLGPPILANAIKAVPVIRFARPQLSLVNGLAPVMILT